MSYGRTPHYIYSCACDGGSESRNDEGFTGHPREPHVAFAAGCVAVRWTELAQFIWKLRRRGELDQVLDGTHEELAPNGVALIRKLEEIDPARAAR